MTIIRQLMDRLFIAIGLLWLWGGTAYAHLAGITDTSIQIGLSQVKVVYTLPTDSLAELSVDGSAKYLPDEKVGQLVGEGFKVFNNEQVCSVEDISQRPINKVEATQFSLLYDCGQSLDSLEIHYSLFVDRFDNHENFTRIAMAGKYVSMVLSSQQTYAQVPVKETVKEWGKTLTNDFEADPNQSFSLETQQNYFPLGVEHILIGFDHLLFLFALLLLPLSFKQLVTMITSFTVAHSITLAMAIFEWVSLPAIWVEAAIAFSIVYVGVENLLELKGRSGFNPIATPWKRRVAVTFLFGLIHGFGFSYVLQEIGLGNQVASALLFFNLGVEAGQLIAVALVFPLLAWIYKRWPSYQFSRACSVLVILMGAVWLVERVTAAVSI